MYARIVAVLFVLTASVAIAQMSDHQGYKDPALFTRMPHYFLSSEDSVVDTPFDAFEFAVKNGTQRVEGRHLHYVYTFDESAGNNPGFLQIVRNYEAAAKKIGGEILSDDIRRTTIRIAKNGQATWVALEAFNEGREYELNIIERQQMKQDVVANAAVLQAGLKENGHAEVPGILFDFGKSDIKPESEPALNEVATLLRTNQAFEGVGGRAHGQCGLGGEQRDAVGCAGRRGRQGPCAARDRGEAAGTARRRTLRACGHQTLPMKAARATGASIW